MSDSNSKTQTVSMGFCGWLALILITLKLAGIGTMATASWWLVTAPIWGPLAIVIVVFAVIMIFAGLVTIFAK